ncbi:hypothetical protein JN01_0009 [Entomoplasma freundtii]|uniref:Uncharacterized protein n=1 Tax=Entomoplasma freundtii TaxID=74700 RepID=A0A2K8NRA1_9MOLU|nr:hypothetical protein [Entomoplasma freundtii]ATZ16066.1 hypothetical protein EFREU_v1c00390 [Entomoplasma freundtii]TDY58065.1 hypothetical protein JN01_0009 [Entomoplasma freundtii]
METCYLCKRAIKSYQLVEDNLQQRWKKTLVHRGCKTRLFKTLKWFFIFLGICVVLGIMCFILGIVLMITNDSNSFGIEPGYLFVLLLGFILPIIGMIVQGIAFFLIRQKIQSEHHEDDFIDQEAYMEYQELHSKKDA